jgi:O-acetyl-ADP-ribose deacetylase (regulator of RNase III)
VEVEAILRSVSSELTPDTPFSRALELEAGPDIGRRLQSMGELPLGAAVLTPGGGSPAPFMIHAVLQSAEEPVKKETVSAALQNGLRRAREFGLESVALPPLGVGPGNLDPQDSAEIMIPLLHRHLDDGLPPLDLVILVGTAYEFEVFSAAVAPDSSGAVGLEG